MDDEWMFEALGAIGAGLVRDPEHRLVLRYRFPPEIPPPPMATDGIPVSTSADLGPEISEEDAADVVERRLSRHFTVKRLDDEAPAGPDGHHGVVRRWVLSERSASPGLDQPMT